MAKTTVAASKRRYTKAPVVGKIVVPARFRDVLGDSVGGVDALLALHYLSEGERLGREQESSIGEDLRMLRTAMIAIMERLQQSPITSNGRASTPSVPATPAAPVAPVSKILPADRKRAHDHAMACARGNEDVAELAFEHVIAAAEANGGSFSSRGIESSIATRVKVVQNSMDSTDYGEQTPLMPQQPAIPVAEALGLDDEAGFEDDK